MQPNRSSIHVVEASPFEAAGAARPLSHRSTLPEVELTASPASYGKAFSPLFRRKNPTGVGNIQVQSSLFFFCIENHLGIDQLSIHQHDLANGRMRVAEAGSWLLVVLDIGASTTYFFSYFNLPLQSHLFLAADCEGSSAPIHLFSPTINYQSAMRFLLSNATWESPPLT